MPRTKAELAAEADVILEQSITNVRKVFDDDDAPATSRASAVSSALKIYEILKSEDLAEKEQSEMSYDELRASIADLRRERNARDDGTDRK